jgi:pimeloyl-ACP methyl ester carboxylesterase
VAAGPPAARCTLYKNGDRNTAVEVSDMRLSWELPVAALVIGLAFSGLSMRAAEPEGTEQIWEGILKVRPGVELRLVFRASKRAGGELVATLDSPDQGATGLKLSSVILDESRLAFVLEPSAAKFDGKLNAAKTEASGTWVQGGGSLELTFQKKERATPEPKIVGREQIWEGKLPVGAGLEFRFVLHLGKSESGELLGKLDSPDEGHRGLKLSAIKLDDKQLAFDLGVSEAKYEGKLNAAKTEAAGTWSQRGIKLPLTFKKTDKATEVRRPQTPKPPFPYQVHDVTYRNEPAGVTLAGTLTAPDGPGPFPAVILISGSGAQDRDETLLQHKPFFVLADALTRRGVAVLRVDDRGVGGSTGNVARSTSEDFAGDVLAGIAYLKHRPEIDAKKIGLIGHSEGGLIAPMVAARSGDVAFIVMIAGTGLPGDEILFLQGRLIAKVLGVDAKGIDRLHEFQRKLFEIIKSETDPKKAAARMGEATKQRLSELSDAERKTFGDTSGLVDALVKQLESPWFRFFLSFDPRPTLTLVRCPVLALNGEKDLQVPPKENLSEIQKALKQGGNVHVTVKELAGLNHLLQTCTTGSVAEYAAIEETIAPAALKVIGDWVTEQVTHR